MDLCAETVRVSDRITLRGLVAQDATAIAAGLAEREITRWLTQVPFPYALADAEWFLTNHVSRGAMGVIVDGVFAGVVHIGAEGELGYWLAPVFHGQGIMTRAAEALVKVHFGKGAGRLTSGYHLGNAASCNVLDKLGFRVTGHQAVRTARGDDVVIRRMLLTSQDWLRIATPRLTIRPLRAADVPALTRIGGVPEVARMMSSVPAPWPIDHAVNWIARGKWGGTLGFGAGICKDDVLIGIVGLGGTPLSVAYFIDPAQAGQGFATEAMRGLLTFAYARFDLDEITADHFTDNPASGRVLEKLGFQKSGMGTGTSLARVEPAPMFLYRLTKARFESRNP